jgi:uncharacterized protein
MEKYKYIIIPLVAVAICQILKFLIEIITNKKVSIIRLLDGAGGLPSSHSTLSSCLTTLIGLNMGFASPIFALSTVFTLIVMYDAMGIRYETEKQAKVINKITKQIKLDNLTGELKNLKEEVGHKPIEVFCGLILGIVLGIIGNNII